MLLVPTELRPSRIHGTGVYLLVPVKKGDLILRFDARFDRVYTVREIKDFPPPMQHFIKTYSSLHEETGLLVVLGDNARFINHSPTPNMSSGHGAFSDEFAAIDIEAGTELTCDYRLTCDSSRANGI